MKPPTFRRNLWLPDATWRIAERLAGERGLEQRGKAYSVSEYIRLLVESDSEQTTREGAGSAPVHRPLPSREPASSPVAPVYADEPTHTGADQRDESAPAPEVAERRVRPGAKLNAGSDDEQGAREVQSGFAEGGEDTKAARRSRNASAPKVLADVGATADEVARRTTGQSPRSPRLNTAPFVGPITKESQTRKNTGK